MNTLKDFVNWKLTHCDKTAETDGYPLTMENCKVNKKMKQLEVYGNSLQDGTPTPEAPIEVQSVGELVTDSADANYGKYKVPIVVKSEREVVTTNVFLNEPLRRIGDYADYIDFKNKKVVRNVREVIFRGGEIKRKLAYYETNLGYSLWVTPENEYANVNMNYFNKNGIHPELSTHFVAETKANSAMVKHGEWYISFDAIYLAIAVGTYETVADVNNWLSSQHDNGTPVKFDYILADPTEEPIDCDLPKLKSKTSVIEVDTSITPSNAYGKYIKK